MSVPRVGLAGTGYWGKNLARNLSALGALAGLCDAKESEARAVAELYPKARLHVDFESLIADHTLDAVAISTPAATHGRLVREALAAEKHVFVEKPMCLTAGEGEELITLAEEAGRKLMVGHLLLYHPAFLALRDAVDNGVLGNLRYIYSHRLSLGRIRREENALWSFAPHDLSMILDLMGGMPETVSASGGQYLSSGVFDTTVSHMDFEGGRQAHIFVSWLHPYKDHRLVVVGEEGMAVFDDVAQGSDKLLLYRHVAEWDADIPVVSKAPVEPIPFVEYEPLRAECEAFLATISGGPPPPSDAAQGLKVLRVLEACQRALDSGVREPVVAKTQHG